MPPGESGGLHIVSFSGGKDSTYMLLEMIRRGMPIDMVLNVDTGIEFAAMYDHIDKVERFLQAERGISITRLKASHTFEELMFRAVKENAEPGDIPGYGWPSVKVRWCTGHLKVHIIDRYLRDLPRQSHQYIAFAADEGYRLQRESNQSEYKHYPLMEWGVTEAQALAGSYAAGYTWNGLYEKLSHVSCWCCPLQNLSDLRALWEFYPEVWTRLRELDDRAIEQFGKENPYGQFKQKESIRMLEYRFAFEKVWAATGGNIRSRAFFRELEKGYQQVFYPTGRYFTGPEYQSRIDRLLSFVSDRDIRLLKAVPLAENITNIGGGHTVAAQRKEPEPTFYRAGRYPEKLEPGIALELKRTVEFVAYYVEKCNLEELSKLPLKDLQDKRKDGVAAEKGLFEKVLAAVQDWENQAVQTMLLDRAIEYVKTPEVAHTSNEWKQKKDGVWEISNRVYKMRYKIVQEKEGNHKGQWLVEWGIAINSPPRPETERYYWSGETMVVDLKKKYYNAEADAQNYIQGRFDVYAHLFTELSPPVPNEFKRHFHINGVLLPGYTVLPPEREPQEVADELLSFLEQGDLAQPEAKAPSPATPPKADTPKKAAPSGKAGKPSRPATKKKPTTKKKLAPVR